MTSRSTGNTGDVDDTVPDAAPRRNGLRRATIRVADFNCDGHIDDSGYFDYLSVLNMGSPSAGHDRYGPLDDFDRFAFTNALNAGC